LLSCEAQLKATRSAAGGASIFLQQIARILLTVA